MYNTQAIRYWEKAASNNPTEKTVKVNDRNDYTDIDKDFILSHSNKDTAILDLASGTGLTLNKYYQDVGHIDAVEMFPALSRFIVKADSVTVHNEDIVEFVPQGKYDLVLMFGIVQYFNEKEVRDLYAKYKDALRPNGKLLVKNQFGVKDDVEVSGISEELGTEYISQYRHLEKEKKILRSVGFGAIRAIDIYPPEANRWENTHFYALVAEPEQQPIDEIDR